MQLATRALQPTPECPLRRLSSRLPRKVCVPCAVPRVLSTDSVSQETQKQSLPSPFPNPRPLLCHSEYVHSELAGLTDRPLSSQISTFLILRMLSHLRLVPGSFGLLSIVDEKEFYCMCNQRSTFGIPITDFCRGRLFTGQGHIFMIKFW